MRRAPEPATLLSIPTELRLKIFEFSIDNSTVHVAENGTISCIHDKVVWAYGQRHQCTTRGCVSGLILSCRQVFHEAIGIYYDKTVFAFACPNALSVFFDQRQTILPYARYISIHCGPAKHTTSLQKGRIRIALELLRQKAPGLRCLWVRLCSYKDIHNDRNLFSNFWLHNLCRLRMLEELCLDIQVDLPGPVHFGRKPDLDLDRIDDKISNTSSMLRQYSTMSDIALEPPAKTQLSHARITVQGHSQNVYFPN